MRVAIIGGIGSGKSVVLNAIKEMGYSTLSADEINKELLKTPSYIEKIKEAFPTCVKNGQVNKKALSDIVFNDDKKRLVLNSIAHPEIAKKIKEDNSKELFVELPLVLESGIKDIFDKFILVNVDDDIRIERLIGRGLTKEKVISIIKSQVEISKLEEIADFVLLNNKTQEELIIKTQELVKSIIK